MVILTILIFSIHEHSISFHLYMSSLISFISVLQFSKCRSFTSLDGFIPRFFILFDSIINGIVSLISLSDSLLLLCGNATDFCILLLYPAILPNSLKNSSSFLVVPLEFSMCSVMSLANSDSSTSFPIWILFISFSYLIAVAKLPKLCCIKVVRVSILVFFMILEEILSASHC